MIASGSWPEYARRSSATNPRTIIASLSARYSTRPSSSSWAWSQARFWQPLTRFLSVLWASSSSGSSRPIWMILR